MTTQHPHTDPGERKRNPAKMRQVNVIYQQFSVSQGCKQTASTLQAGSINQKYAIGFVTFPMEVLARLKG